MIKVQNPNNKFQKNCKKSNLTVLELDFWSLNFEFLGGSHVTLNSKEPLAL